MKYLLVAGALALAAGQALAADLPAPSMPRVPVFIPPPAPSFSWSSIYLGGNLGAGWNQGTLTDSFFGYNWVVNNSATFVGGGQIGGNYQVNDALVLGFEADFDWLANSNNSGSGVTAFNTVVQGSDNSRWLATLTGRVGIAADQLLFYAKGGGAWVGSDNLTILDVPTGQTVSLSNTNTNTGWTAGAGIEWAFADNWTVRAEYDFVGLSNYNLTIPTLTNSLGTNTLAGDTFSTNNRSIQMITLGVNVLFH